MLCFDSNSGKDNLSDPLFFFFVVDQMGALSRPNPGAIVFVCSGLTLRIEV